MFGAFIKYANGFYRRCFTNQFDSSFYIDKRRQKDALCRNKKALIRPKSESVKSAVGTNTAPPDSRHASFSYERAFLPVRARSNVQYSLPCPRMSKRTQIPPFPKKSLGKYIIFKLNDIIPFFEFNNLMFRYEFTVN